jgi:hypothetical protein
MTKNYLELFRSLFEELKQNDMVEIFVAKIPDSEEGLAEYSISDLRSHYGFSIPDHYVDFIEVSLYTHLRFVYYRGGKVTGGGEFHLRPLYDALISTRDPELWHKGMDPQEIAFLKHFRIFDDHPDAGDFKMAAFHLMPGVSPPALPDIYFYDRGEYYRMNIDYGGYLDSLLALFGVSNWQYFFCDIDLSQSKYVSLFDELNDTIAQLSELFPQRSFEPYRERLSSMRGERGIDR